MDKRLLLISNSKTYGGGYLLHCGDTIVEFLGKIKHILFIPYALFDRDNYAQIAKSRFKQLGIMLTSIHEINDPVRAIQSAESLFVGGGNTFRLLNDLYKHNLLDKIITKVSNGMPYIGTSAGSIVACPSIRTTNDMPIVYPPSFDSLNLVPFQINPHYLDPDLNSRHMGETRDARIKEYHEENDYPVIGLRENSWLNVHGKSIRIEGNNNAKIFIKDKEQREIKKGELVIF